MKKDGLLNSEIIKEIAALGHTEYLCIGDCGLPVPKGVKTIDVAITANVPGFMDVLKTVDSELVIESYILAEEIKSSNCKVENEVKAVMGDIPCAYVSHEKFKKLMQEAKCVIRTGETSSYANVILVGGVNF